jgi:hypothetical protein
MRDTGNVQWNGQGTHRVANPPGPDTYQVAPPGDVYVEYEVPTDALRPHSPRLSWLLPPFPPSRGSGCRQLYPATTMTRHRRSYTSNRQTRASWRT